MKKLLVLPLLLAIALFISAFAFFPQNEVLTLGTKAPKTEVKMLDISGKEYSLKDLQKKNGLLVIFSCNTCPFVVAWENLYPELGKLSEEKGVGMVLINSNEAFREKADSYEAMKKHAAEQGYNCPYVIDENSVVADAFGARTTPHVFLFDKNMQLVFEGAMDNKFERKDETATEHYLKDAIVNLAAGREIEPAKTQARGCSIKRKKV